MAFLKTDKLIAICFDVLLIFNRIKAIDNYSDQNSWKIRRSKEHQRCKWIVLSTNSCNRIQFVHLMCKQIPKIRVVIRGGGMPLLHQIVSIEINKI